MEDQEEKKIPGDPAPPVDTVQGFPLPVDKIDKDPSTEIARPKVDLSSPPEHQESTTKMASDSKEPVLRQDSTNGSAVGFHHNLWAEPGSQQPSFEFNSSEVTIPGKRRVKLNLSDKKSCALEHSFFE